MTASTEVITLSSSPPRERLSPRKSRFLHSCTSDQGRLSQHAVQRQSPRYRLHSGSLTFPVTPAESSGLQTARDYSTFHTRCTIFHQANADVPAGSKDKHGSTDTTKARSKFTHTTKSARPPQIQHSPAHRTTPGQSREDPIGQESETRSPVLLRESYRKSGADVSPSARFDVSLNKGSPTPSPRGKFMLSRGKLSANSEKTTEENSAATNARPTTKTCEPEASESASKMVYSPVEQIEPTGSKGYSINLECRNEGIHEGPKCQSRQQEAVPLQDLSAGLDAHTSLTGGISRAQVRGAEQAPNCLATAVSTKKLPAVTKKPAKSSRTVTGIVLAAYRGQESYDTPQSEKPCEPIVAFSRLDHVDKDAPGQEIDNVAQDVDVKPQKPGPESVKRKRKPSATTRKRGRSRIDLPPLPPPEVALEHLREQQWLFGTSSQLVSEEKSAGLSDATGISAPSISNAHKGVSSIIGPCLEPSNAIWEAATFVGDETEYSGEMPIVGPQATASPDGRSQNLDPLPAGSPTAQYSTTKLSVASYRRVKPPLLCATGLLQTATTLNRLPLSDLPTNTQMMRSISSLNKRTVVPCGEQETVGNAKTGKVTPSERNKAKRSKVSPAVKEPQKDQSAKKPKGRPRGKKTEDDSSTAKAKPVPQTKRRRAAASSPPAASKHRSDGKATPDREGFHHIDESSPEAVEQIPSKPLASTGIDPPKRTSPRKSSPKRSAQARKRPAPTVIEGDKLETLKADVFPRVTQAIVSCQPSDDPTSPNWYEKILLYDPIVLEDLTDWLNEGNIKDFDRSLQPSEVQKWCEYNSVCCIWREGLRGGVKLLY